MPFVMFVTILRDFRQVKAADIVITLSTLDISTAIEAQNVFDDIWP